jgi:hypothetical protein
LRPRVPCPAASCPAYLDRTRLNARSCWRQCNGRGSNIFSLKQVMRQKGIARIIDLSIIPAGNADWKVNEATEEKSIECQHGEGECEGNKMIACLEKHASSNPVSSNMITLKAAFV